MGADGYYSLNGKQLAFTIITTPNYPLRDQAIAAIAAQVKLAGIKVTEMRDADIFAGPDKPMSLAAHRFQIALYSLSGTVPPLSSYTSIYQTDGAHNYSRGNNAAVDAQLTTAASAEDQLKAANQADKLLWNDMFALPLYQRPRLLAFDSNYTGVADNTTSAGPLWNSDEFAIR